MTNLFQPLNLMVKRSAKAFIKRKFNEWYSLQVIKQLDFAKTFEDIEVKFLLSTLKQLHADLVLKWYNYLKSVLGKKIIAHGWKVVGISDAIKKIFFLSRPPKPFIQHRPSGLTNCRKHLLPPNKIA